MKGLWVEVQGSVGNFYRVIYRGSVGMLEKEMDTTMWGLGV